MFLGMEGTFSRYFKIEQNNKYEKMEVTGKKIKMIELKLDLEVFKKRDVVVTTDEQYPQHISVQFVQDNKCDLLNNFQVGEAVK
jgi:hypothetical protein